MPPRRAFNGRRPSTRTTSGCLVCRQRRLKCDGTVISGDKALITTDFLQESKPSCQRCTKAGFHCEYGLTLSWPSENAKPGNNRGRRFSSTLSPDLVESRNATSIARPLSTYPSMTDHDGAIFDFCACPPKAWIYLFLSLPTFNFTFSNSQSCVADASHMCPQCRLRDGNNHLYREIIIPIAFESDLLRKSVLAVGANRLKIQNVALKHQTGVLGELQRRLPGTAKSIDQSPASLLRVEILAVILLLSFYELDSASGTDDSTFQPWRIHMQGAQNLLQDSSPQPTSSWASMEIGIISFLAQYFACRSCLSYATTLLSETDDELFPSAQYWLSRIDRPTQEINLFAGCSNELLGLILIISKEIRSAQHGKSQHAFESWRCSIQEIQQHIPSPVCSTTPNTQMNAIVSTAEAFRLATLVLLELLEGLSICSDANRSIETPALSKLYDLLVTRDTPLVSACGSLGASSYLWPYYIASCYLVNEEERQNLHQTLRAMSGSTSSKIKDGMQQANLIDHILSMLEDVPSPSPRCYTPLQVSSNEMFIFEDPLFPTNQHSLQWS